MKYYAIIERSYNFCVLETGFGGLNDAWDRANKLQQDFSDIIEDVDVLVFNSKRERLEYIRENTK